MEVTSWQLDLGANPAPEGRGTRFRVWAPEVETVAVHIVSGKAAGTVSLQQEEKGFFSGRVPGVVDGDRYFYNPGAGPVHPDPVSAFQPDGVHEAPQVVDPRFFVWQDEGWSGIPLEQCLIHELHVETFTKEGTFEAVIPFLNYLLELGVSAVELMPVSQFPGERGWGYDGVCPFAPQNSYGGPGGLKQLINACHRKGIAVIPDLVCNHFGPEGNYLGDIGHHLTDKYHTPWGPDMNFDGAGSDPVRQFFHRKCAVPDRRVPHGALRLDAVDWIQDQRAQHFLRQIASEVHSYRLRLGRQVYLFAGNDTNDARLTDPVQCGGYGTDGQWCDNFHHPPRALPAGETTGYHEDFGQFSEIVKAYGDGFVHTGKNSTCRKRCHGGPVGERPTSQFMVFAKNMTESGTGSAATA